MVTAYLVTNKKEFSCFLQLYTCYYFKQYYLWAGLKRKDEWQKGSCGALNLQQPINFTIAILHNDDFKNFTTMYITVITPETTFLYIKYIGKQGSELPTRFSRKINLHIWIRTGLYYLPRNRKKSLLVLCWAMSINRPT